MQEFKLKIISYDHVFYEGDCISLVVPTIDGLYGILANHTNTVTSISPGTLKYTTPDNEEHFASVSFGIVKVEDYDVLILVGTCEKPEDIDAIRAQRELDEAREQMLQKQSVLDYKLSRAQMAKSFARLKTSNLNRNK